jgi:aminoglycoside phosphotransferase (APT) family kinase protein
MDGETQDEAHPRVHADNMDVDTALVRGLLSAQFPHWAELPLVRTRTSGTDHAVFRLGDELALRLPLRPSVIHQADRDQRWLPVFAPLLPLVVPAPIAMGVPDESFPYRWTIVPWIEGEDATYDRLGDPVAAARDLASFINALQRIDATDGPGPSARNYYRGVALRELDSNMREFVAMAGSLIDARAVLAVWEAALAVPEYAGEPSWIHGDLMPGNILARDGRLVAVIDFGCLGVGDPAPDVTPAWSIFSGESRRAFRDALDVDDATWARGRGWVVRQAAGGIAYYTGRNPVIVERGWRTLREVLGDGGV